MIISRMWQDSKKFYMNWVCLDTYTIYNTFNYCKSSKACSTKTRDSSLDLSRTENQLEITKKEINTNATVFAISARGVKRNRNPSRIQMPILMGKDRKAISKGPTIRMDLTISHIKRVMTIAMEILEVQMATLALKAKTAPTLRIIKMTIFLKIKLMLWRRNTGYRNKRMTETIKFCLRNTTK